MDNYQRFGLLAGQFYTGIGFGRVGAIASLAITDIFFHRVELSTIGYYSYIGFFIGNQIGIGFNGLRLLTKFGRRGEFIKYFGLSVLGMIFGQGITYFSFLHIANELSIWLGYFVWLTLTLGGPMLGFNYKLINIAKEKG
jgi:hypothetical protein